MAAGEGGAVLVIVAAFMALVVVLLLLALRFLYPMYVKTEFRIAADDAALAAAQDCTSQNLVNAQGQSVGTVVTANMLQAQQDAVYYFNQNFGVARALGASVTGVTVTATPMTVQSQSTPVKGPVFTVTATAAMPNPMYGFFGPQTYSWTDKYSAQDTFN